MKELLESLCVWISWKLPRGLVYWCFVRVVTENCLGNPGDRTAHDAGESWMNRPAPRTLDQKLPGKEPTPKQFAIDALKRIHRACNSTLDHGDVMVDTGIRSIRELASKAWVKLENEK